MSRLLHCRLANSETRSSDLFDHHIVGPRQRQIIGIGFAGLGFLGSWSLGVLLDSGDDAGAATSASLTSS